jgi:hypothetical protein
MGNDGERVLGIPLMEHGGHSFPSDVGLEPTPNRYVGFYENQHGEQLIFIRESDGQPLLYHGDFGWARLPAEWPQRYKNPKMPLSPWVSGELILNQGEVLWLVACLEASGSFEGKNLGEGPLDRLLMQAVKEGFQHQEEDFDRKWSLREKAVELWKERQEAVPAFEEEHYAEGAILLVLGLNARQRKPRRGVTKEIRERLEREAEVVVNEAQG